MIFDDNPNENVGAAIDRLRFELRVARSMADWLERYGYGTVAARVRAAADDIQTSVEDERKERTDK